MAVALDNDAVYASALYPKKVLFEYNLNKEKFDKISKHKTIKKCKVTEKYIQQYIKKVGLPAESFDRIDKFIVTGVNFDFFCKLYKGVIMCVNSLTKSDDSSTDV